jgi:hypothetical protein
MSIRWCSRSIAAPGFLFASSAIHCRFVDRLVEFVAPSRVSRQWLSPRGVSLPSGGFRPSPVSRVPRYYEGATTSHSVSASAYEFRSRSPRLTSSFVSALSRTPARRRSQAGLVSWSTGRPFPGALFTWTVWDLSGSLGDPSRAFAQFQDPGRTDETSPLAVPSVLPPRTGSTKASTRTSISGLMLGFSARCLRFTKAVADSHARLASGRLACLYRARVELAGSLRKVSDHSMAFPLSGASPDASLLSPCYGPVKRELSPCYPPVPRAPELFDQPSENKRFSADSQGQNRPGTGRKRGITGRNRERTGR